MKGTGKRILLLGDSHARMLIPTFTAIAEKDDLSLSVDGEPSCPWQRGLYTPSSFGSCQRLKTDAYRRVIRELQPDIVVVMNLDYGKPGRDYPKTLMTFQGHAATLRTLERLTRESVDTLTAGGRQLIIVEPTPLALEPSRTSTRTVASNGHASRRSASTSRTRARPRSNGSTGRSRTKRQREDARSRQAGLPAPAGVQPDHQRRDRET